MTEVLDFLWKYYVVHAFVVASCTVGNYSGGRFDPESREVVQENVDKYGRWIAVVALILFSIFWPVTYAKNILGVFSSSREDGHG